MSDERPPARPWFDVAMREASIRGWTLTELAKRAKVSRPTIYGWRDNLGIPQAAPVNSAADLLGIDRERALRLAGIITEAADRSPPTLLDERLGDDADVIRRLLRDMLPDQADAVLAGLEERLRRRASGHG